MERTAEPCLLPQLAAHRPPRTAAQLPVLTCCRRLSRGIIQSFDFLYTSKFVVLIDLLEGKFLLVSAIPLM
ncbi:hypothetical protein EJB05_23930, partial [Eragrostis curvula]